MTPKDTPHTATQGASESSEREAFERYATSRGRSVYRADLNGPYGSDEVDGWWQAYQAALAQRQPAPADPQAPSQEQDQP